MGVPPSHRLEQLQHRPALATAASILHRAAWRKQRCFPPKMVQLYRQRSTAATPDNKHSLHSCCFTTTEPYGIAPSNCNRVLAEQPSTHSTLISASILPVRGCSTPMHNPGCCLPKHHYSCNILSCALSRHCRVAAVATQNTRLGIVQRVRVHCPRA